jgi:cytochrome c
MVARLSGRCRLALLAAGVVVSVVLPATAQTGAQLASDKGCYNCHGNPPRKSTPRFTDLAQRYAPYKLQPDQERALAEKLRKGSFLGHVDAHERLSAEDAAALVHWIIDGAR